MTRHALDEMVRGWFVGDFEPTAYRTSEVEVAIKHYVAGDAEERHVHKVATELTAVVSGFGPDGRSRASCRRHPQARRRASRATSWP